MKETRVVVNETLEFVPASSIQGEDMMPLLYCSLDPSRNHVVVEVRQNATHSSVSTSLLRNGYMVDGVLLQFIQRGVPLTRVLAA